MSLVSNWKVTPYRDQEWIALSKERGNWVLPGAETSSKAEVCARAFFQVVSDPKEREYRLEKERRRLRFASESEVFPLTASTVCPKDLSILQNFVGQSLKRIEETPTLRRRRETLPSLTDFQQLNRQQQSDLLCEIGAEKAYAGAPHCLWIIGHTIDHLLVKRAFQALIAMGGVPLSEREREWIDQWVTHDEVALALCAMETKWLAHRNPYATHLRDTLVTFIKKREGLSSEEKLSALKLLAQFNWNIWEASFFIGWLKDYIPHASSEVRDEMILLQSFLFEGQEMAAEAAWYYWPNETALPHGITRREFLDKLRSRWIETQKRKEKQDKKRSLPIQASHRMDVEIDPHLPPEGNLYCSCTQLVPLLMGKAPLMASASYLEGPITVVFKAEYYEEAYLRGRGRYHKPYFHLPQGLSLRQMEALIVPQAYAFDIRLLRSEHPLEEVHRSLRHPELRSHAPDTIQRLRYALKRVPALLHFVDSTDQETLETLRLVPCSKEEIQRSSEEYHAGRTYAMRVPALSLAREMIDLHTLRHLLQTENVDELSRELLSVARLLDIPVARFQEIRSYYKKNELKELLTHWEHLFAVTVGLSDIDGRGSFGLQTEVAIEGWDQKRVRMVLRLAALMHKERVHTPDDQRYVTTSYFNAAELLSCSQEALEISDEESALIPVLIENHLIFEKYLAGEKKRKITRKKLHDTLKSSYDWLQEKNPNLNLSFADFGRLLWSLYLAKASTRRAVRFNHREVYRPYWEADKIQTLNFESLEFLCEIRRAWKPAAPLPQPQNPLPHLLIEGTDSEFATGLDACAEKIGVPVAKWNGLRNNHGSLKSDRSKKMTLWQHTADVIAPRYGLGGFGLKTDGITVEGWNDSDVRMVLRLSALYHDSGKYREGSATLERRGHEKRSITCARAALSSHLPQDKMEIIAQLIGVNSLFGDCLQKKMTPQKVYAALEEAHSDLPPGSISFPDFCKLTWILFIADASTLPQIYTNQEMYTPLLDTLNGNFYHEEEWLETLNTQVQAKRAAARKQRGYK